MDKGSSVLVAQDGTVVGDRAVVGEALILSNVEHTPSDPTFPLPHRKSVSAT